MNGVDDAWVGLVLRVWGMGESVWKEVDWSHRGCLFGFVSCWKKSAEERGRKVGGKERGI